MSSDDHPGALTPDMLQTHVRLVDVADLEDWSGPYQGDIGAAHTHLGAFGQLQLPVVSGGAVVYGQEFVAAERVDGQYGGRMAVLDLTDLDWPREKIIAAVLGLDRLKALQAVDAEQLLGLLQEVRKADEAWLTGAGYDGDDLEAIYEQLQRDQEALDAMAGRGAGLADGVDADDVPDSAPAITQPGDVWIIGPHRVVCGDATSSADVERALNGATPAVVFTDPPYNADYSSRVDKQRRKPWGAIVNDNLTAPEFAELIRDALAVVACRLTDGSAVYVWTDWKSYPTVALEYRQILTQKGTIVWDKGHFGLGTYYRTQYELLLFGCKGDSIREWNAGHDERDVWAVSRDPTGGYEHPTQKPVELACRALRNSSQHGDVVVDVFGGSGSTLVAAHMEGRSACLVELAPQYVDVICKRAQLATGIEPVLESTGEAHDFTEGG